LQVITDGILVAQVQEEEILKKIPALCPEGPVKKELGMFHPFFHVH
jgi:hypothetical protein